MAARGSPDRREDVTPDLGGAGGSAALLTVHRRVRTGARPDTVPCAGCGTDVPFARRGPLPKWCGQTCRQRGWEQRRAAAELAETGVAIAVREVVQVPVPLRPERSEWVGELAELTRQIAALELPDGCLHPVYEALTVAINQLVHRNNLRYAGHQYGFRSHPALPGREQRIADQLDTTTSGTSAAEDRMEIAYDRAQRRAEARMKRRFPHGF
jgi:hypothetical protein